MIDNLRLQPGVPLVPSFQRVVVAVDPSGCSGENDLRADEIGIVVAALGSDGHVYVLQDLSGLYSPEAWGRAAVVAYGAWNADRIVAEKNFGGDMVRAVIQGVRIDDKAVGRTCL
jgi:phage terminase large subunit-like protein